MQQTRDEGPVNKSCPQKNKKPEAAIRGPIGFPFPEALRRHHRLRRSILGTATNERRSSASTVCLRFSRQPPNGIKTTIPRVHRVAGGGAEFQALGKSTCKAKQTLRSVRVSGRLEPSAELHFPASSGLRGPIALAGPPESPPSRGC